MQMNVSKEADAEFMRLLESEDPKRCANFTKNLRRDNPDTNMSEHQALTNWMLGLPTGQWRFDSVAGKNQRRSDARIKADRTLQEGTIGEYVGDLMAFVNEPDSLPVFSTGRRQRRDARFKTVAQKQKAYRERKSRTVSEIG